MWTSFKLFGVDSGVFRSRCRSPVPSMTFLVCACLSQEQQKPPWRVFASLISREHIIEPFDTWFRSRPFLIDEFEIRQLLIHIPASAEMKRGSRRMYSPGNHPGGAREKAAFAGRRRRIRHSRPLGIQFRGKTHEPPSKACACPAHQGIKFIRPGFTDQVKEQFG